MKLRQGKIFRRMCQEFCPRRGGGMCGRGWGLALGLCTWQGACVVGGIWVVGVCAWQGACIAGKTAIAAGSTHPTGIHSCFNLTRQIEKEYQLKFYFLGHINLFLSKCCYLQWRIQDLSLRRGPNSQSGYNFAIFYAENCTKMKEFGPAVGIPGSANNLNLKLPFYRLNFLSL